MSTQNHDTPINETSNTLFEHAQSNINTTDAPTVNTEGLTSTIDAVLHDEEIPEDYSDYQSRFQKPNEVMSEQEKEDAYLSEPKVVCALDEMKNNAWKSFEFGTMALYIAIGWAYIWKYFVNKNTQYKEEVFKDEVDQENSDDNTKTIKVCFKLNVKQKSTISMYKNCLAYLEDELPDTIKYAISDDVECANKIAGFIKSKGGIKKCANLYKGKINDDKDEDDGDTKTVTKNDYKRAKEDYLSSPNVTGSLSNSCFEKYSDDDLVIMVARKMKGKKDEVEVVDVITDDSLLDAIIKFNKQ